MLDVWEQSAPATLFRWRYGTFVEYQLLPAAGGPSSAAVLFSFQNESYLAAAGRAPCVRTPGEGGDEDDGGRHLCSTVFRWNGTAFAGLVQADTPVSAVAGQL